jgi:hypothetical protein
MFFLDDYVLFSINIIVTDMQRTEMKFDSRNSTEKNYHCHFSLKNHFIFTHRVLFVGGNNHSLF